MSEHCFWAAESDPKGLRVQWEIEDPKAQKAIPALKVKPEVKGLRALLDFKVPRVPYLSYIKPQSLFLIRTASRGLVVLLV